MSMWNPTLVEASLNLRIARGHKASDYKLSGEVAESQRQYDPDFICNCEDMEDCDSDEYDGVLAGDYKRIAATNDHQGRGVSCWVKSCYSAEKIFSMTSPHFMHVRVTNDKGIEINLLILRILISDSGIADFKDRHDQWLKALRYVDSLNNKNIVLVGDWNHGVIGDLESYVGRPRQFFNYQMIEKSLSDRGIQLVPMAGYSYKGFMAIDHLAVSDSVTVENARYEDVYGTDVSEIGTPDHSFIVSELRMCG